MDNKILKREKEVLLAFGGIIIGLGFSFLFQAMGLAYAIFPIPKTLALFVIGSMVVVGIAVVMFGAFFLVYLARRK